MKLTVKETRQIIQELKGRGSLENLARELGISFKAIDNWTRGRFTPSQMSQMILKRYAEENRIECIITTLR